MIEACIRPGGLALRHGCHAHPWPEGWSSKRLELGSESWAHSDSLALLGVLGVPERRGKEHHLYSVPHCKLLSSRCEVERCRDWEFLSRHRGHGVTGALLAQEVGCDTTVSECLAFCPGTVAWTPHCKKFRRGGGDWEGEMWG